MQTPTRLKRYLKAVTAAVLLTPLGLWLLAFGWPQRHLYYRDYRFDQTEARRLAIHPQAMLAYGDHAWQNLDPDQAVLFYRRAVLRDVLYMDAWLKLAQAKSARGQKEGARAILTFVTETAGHTSRWQSSIALLAHELEMEGTFRRSINFLVGRKLNINSTLTLLDAHCGDAKTSLAALDSENLPIYIEWLTRWGRLSDARFAWQHLVEHRAPDESIVLKYIDFLVNNKLIDEAQTIRQAHSGTIGVTNGGFDWHPSGKGFDWRVYSSPEGYWKILYAAGEGRDHTTGLKILFSGRANVDFRHLYQIVPLTPGIAYRLTYAWRGLRLNTDQGPFIDLEGYDCNIFYARGPMILGSTGWHEVRIEFTLPEDCGAAKLRLRRMPSNRFDNKIEGALWLDDFLIKPLGVRADGK